MRKLEKTIGKTVSKIQHKQQSQKRRSQQLKQRTQRKILKQSKKQAVRNEATIAARKQELQKHLQSASFKATTKQMNMASSKKTESASVYTKTQVKAFYRVYQNLWQKSNVSPKQRNEAIVEGVNIKRIAEGKKPYTLKEIMDKFVQANVSIFNAYDTDLSKPLTEEQLEKFHELQQADDADNAAGSPPTYTATVVGAIRTRLEQLFDVSLK